MAAPVRPSQAGDWNVALYPDHLNMLGPVCSFLVPANEAIAISGGLPALGVLKRFVFDVNRFGIHMA